MKNPSLLYSSVKSRLATRLSEVKLLRAIAYNSVALVGSKRYDHLELSCIIDSFQSIIRLNLGMPGAKNGYNEGHICLNAHLWHFATAANPTLQEFLANYQNRGDFGHLTTFFNLYIRDKSTDLYHVRNTFRRNARFLARIGYPRQMLSHPRVGISVLLFLISTYRIKPVLFGFSVDNEEARASFYQSSSRISNEQLHSSEEESALLLWLAERGLIDLSFCLLKDSSTLSFKESNNHLVTDTAYHLLTTHSLL